MPRVDSNPAFAQVRGASIAPRKDTMLQGFWLFVGLLIVWVINNVENVSSAIFAGSLLMAVVALYPSYLWCARKALGVPIFPLFALTYLWTYALQLLDSHPQVVTYSIDSQLFASITVAGFLALGTWVWYQFVNATPEPPQYYRAFNSQQAEVFLLFSLGLSVFFNMNTLGGWFSLDGGIFAIIRAVMLATNALAIFSLAYNWGTQASTKATTYAFVILLIADIVTSAVSLLLVGSLTAFLLATIAFILGRRQIPWLPIALALLCFGFLHMGKSEMRSHYWQPNQTYYVQPWEYPSWYGEWLGYSLQNSNTEETAEDPQSPLERSSLMHLLLMAQAKTPNDVPYLAGKTYAIIPQLLVPRFLNPQKIRSHEGTYLLNIHYGLQTRADTEITVIGWGLLNEAYANFGLVGCAGLAIILGAGYGLVTRWSINTPILSARFLFAILIVGFAFQTEFSAGVYVAALFQSVMPLIGVTLLFMNTYKTGYLIHNHSSLARPKILQ